MDDRNKKAFKALVKAANEASFTMQEFGKAVTKLQITGFRATALQEGDVVNLDPAHRNSFWFDIVVMDVVSSTTFTMERVLKPWIMGLLAYAAVALTVGALV